MSLILDALKKVQRKRIEEAEIVPTAYTAERKQRRLPSFKLLYLAGAVPVLIFCFYLLPKGMPQYSRAIDNPVQRGGTSTQQTNREIAEVKPEGTVQEKVQKRMPLEEFLPSSNPAQKQNDLSTVTVDAKLSETSPLPGLSSERSSTAVSASPTEPGKSEQAEGPIFMPPEFSAPLQPQSARQVEQWIRDLVAKYQIELPLVLALMKQESNLNPYMVSKEGAVGLCQIMPAMGLQLGLKVPQYGDPLKPTADHTIDERFDPYRAMEAAFAYLRQLLDKYDGNVPLALSAYNAGMGRTKSRVARIYETTTYVSDIMTFYWRYQDEAVLQQAMEQLVANIKSPPPIIPETQEGDESRPAEDIVPKPSASSTPVAKDPTPLPVASPPSSTSSVSEAGQKQKELPPTEPEAQKVKPTEQSLGVNPTTDKAGAEQKQKELPPTEPETRKADGPGQDEKPAEQNSKINLTTDKADYHFNLGVFHQSQGNSQKAMGEYKEAVKLDPSRAQAHNNMGTIYKEMGLLDEAIQEYRKALSINPGYEKVLNNLGVALYLKGDLENAIKELQKSMEINPENCAGYINLGLVFKKQGLIEEAIKTFQKALSIDPKYPEAYYNLALTFEEIGEAEVAITYYKGFLKVASGKYAALAKAVERHIKVRSKIQ